MHRLYWTKAMKICGTKWVYGSPALQPVIQKERSKPARLLPPPWIPPSKTNQRLLFSVKSHIWKISIMCHAIDLAYPKFEIWITGRVVKAVMGAVVSRKGVCPLSLLIKFSIFSERELKFMFAIRHRRSVCRLSSVTFVRPTQAIQIFGNISTACDTLAICELCIKILRRSSQGNPSVGGVKHKRGSRI